ncbi:hypothetical protein EYZ11_010694 [Aspergillus tanneri]|uniref:Uncharacterized protein n=1 Tax=Aspergillus tanneri TaxID=1220188 RepID=A0A4S3J4N7_9EURO|nr:hypothetical protein EYZ11_010694 [Aspergillus tanneri]
MVSAIDPGVVITGPYFFIKKQAPFQYGTRLGDEGYAALTFDPQTVGESTSQSRLLENPKMKNEDALAGLVYLFLVLICQGGSQSFGIASYDGPVVGVASVTGYYRDQETDM